MNRLSVKLSLSLLVAAVGTYGAFVGLRTYRELNERPDPKRALHLQPARLLADFEFTERSGRRVRLSDLEGDVFVVNFFFANCPGSCRQFSTTIAGLQTELQKADVRFVSVTVDPNVDTPERLANYAKEFGADADRWWFLNAPLGETQELGRTLHVTVAGTTHTDELVLVDRRGVIRGAYDHKSPQKLTKFKADLRTLLEEQPRGTVKSRPAKPSSTASSQASAASSTAAPPVAAEKRP